MLQLYITQAKPNPAGKDKQGAYIPPQQLAAEWIDFKNIGNEPCLLEKVTLKHVAYSHQHPDGAWEVACTFTGVLHVGKTLRVHSGGKIDLSLLNKVDLDGADHHVFTGKSYLWNNAMPDQAKLVITQNWRNTDLDIASYAANPQEGRILQRSGNKLI